MKKDHLTMSRNQNFKSYGRGKHSNHPGTVVNSSIQFDKFFFNNSNKPTASKSAGTIGKWGVTSFTSLRSSSFTVGGTTKGAKETSRFSSLGKKRTQPAPDSGVQAKRPVLNNNIKRDGSPLLSTRKFFKSRNASEDPKQKSYKSANATEGQKGGKHSRTSDENKRQKNTVFEPNKSAVQTFEKPLKISTKKVAAAKIANDNVTFPEDFERLPDLPSPPKERDKPPIVLRIFKGTSRLISETGSKSDTSETETSPRAEPIPEDIQISTDVLSESPEKPLIVAAEPEPTVSGRVLRRRSPEQAEIPLPETIPPVKVSRSRAAEKAKSLSPEPIVKTRSLRRRSPEKSKSPSPEPTITTRSLRRRQAPSEVVPPSSPHTSPKRTLRSTKNTAPAATSAPAGKIVITNLNSDHPSVYMSNDGAPAPVQSPPLRKDPKEHRSYGNKHRHKAKVEAIAAAAAAAKHELPEVSEEKVEELLANIDAPVSIPEESEESDVMQPTKIADTSLDEDRAELLQLLEDDEEEDGSKHDRKSDNTAPTSASVAEEPKVGNASRSTVVNSESQLKIKIKLAKPTVKEEPTEEPTTTAANVICDSQDSGIDVKSEIDSHSSSAMDVVNEEDEKPTSSELSKESEEKLIDGEPNVDSDSRIEIPNIASSSVPIAAVTSKKGSIFKHRSSNGGNKKRLALYKHKWADDKDSANNPEEDKNADTALKSKTLDSMFDMDMDEMPLTKFIRQPAAEKFDFDDSGPITGIKCAKKNKDFYTVVRNVKKAHQIQESGEFQEFNDDVEYILDALQDNNPIGTRCLSAITLATKCTEPAFRMHVRAHGTVTKFFRTLHDATKDQSLGLCTATVMFVLSQDRLNMDLDSESLELMLNLLESDASHTKALEDCGLTDSQLTKTRDKVRQICADIQAQGHAKHLDLENITVGHLSMETLLSLTSKRAGEWFKEELRELGGLEHIIKTVVECCKHVDDTANAWSTTSLEKIRKVDRCLRVLENVTMLNEENNDYLLDYQNGILIDTLVRMFKVCDYEIPLYPMYSISDKESTGAVLRECLIANLKVLINVTHDYQKKSNGSSVIGSRPGVIESSLHVLLQVPQYIPKEEKFDLMLLTLIMLINLVQHCESNRKAIIEAKAPSGEEKIFESKSREPAVKALILMFYNYEELARNEEKKTDAILEGENTAKPPTDAPQKTHEDFIEETISQLVQKAGQNMEHTLIAAYVAMLIGYLIKGNEDYEKFVRNYLPKKNFQFMVAVLQKFYSFMTLTASGGTASSRDMKSIQIVIQNLIDSDRRHGFDPQTAQGSSSDSSNNFNNLDSSDLEAIQSNFSESQSTSDVTLSAS